MQYTDGLFFIFWGMLLTVFFGSLYIYRNDQKKFGNIVLFGLVAEVSYIIFSGLAEYIGQNFVHALNKALSAPLPSVPDGNYDGFLFAIVVLLFILVMRPARQS